MVTQDQNSKTPFITLKSLRDQRREIAKHGNAMLKCQGLHASLSIDEICKVQYKCTIYLRKPEDKFVVPEIKYFNNLNGGW